MKDEMMAKIMDEVMKKMGGTEAPAQSMACEAPQGINEDPEELRKPCSVQELLCHPSFS